jgi:hypothetical protein
VRFSYSATFYLDAYRAYRVADALCDDAESDPFQAPNLQAKRKARVKLAIASKGTDAIPFVLQMLRSDDREECDDARGVLALMGTDARVVDSFISSVAEATDSDTVTTLVMALGALANPLSIPCLARILGARGISVATVEAAVTSLGVLTHRQFDLDDDPRAAALHWLQMNGYKSVTVQSSLPEPRSESAVLPGGLVHIQIQVPQTDEDCEPIAASTEETRE